MKHLVLFSGGKDSMATWIWAKKNIDNYEVVFCDTGWESPKTYDYIKYAQKVMNEDITILKNAKFPNGMADLAKRKTSFPSTKRRFCTTSLKVEITIDYILTHNEDLTILQGVRADESSARRSMKAKDDYFSLHLDYDVSKTKEVIIEEKANLFKEGRRCAVSKRKTKPYRFKDVMTHLEQYSVDVYRPIFFCTAEDVFQQIADFGLQANPLYKEGFSRVGCFPCIMCNHSEIRMIAKNYPERVEYIAKLEEEIGSTFFPPNYIPTRFCTKEVEYKDKKGNIRIKKVPTISDVVRYVSDDENQAKMYQQKACISIYNICE